MTKLSIAKLAIWLALTMAVPGATVQGAQSTQAPPAQRQTQPTHATPAPHPVPPRQPESDSHQAGRQVNETATKVGAAVVKGSVMIGHSVRDFFTGVAGH